MKRKRIVYRKRLLQEGTGFLGYPSAEAFYSAAFMPIWDFLTIPWELRRIKLLQNPVL